MQSDADIIAHALNRIKILNDCDTKSIILRDHNYASVHIPFFQDDISFTMVAYADKRENENSIGVAITTGRIYIQDSEDAAPAFVDIHLDDNVETMMHKINNADLDNGVIINCDIVSAIMDRFHSMIEKVKEIKINNSPRKQSGPGMAM